jgi:fructokinase
MKQIVVGIGEALWDLLPSGRHLGGAPLNFAYISSLLGEHAIIVTRIGNDPLGDDIRQELGRRQLDITGIQVDPHLPTGTVDVSFNDGQPHYDIRQPVAWDALEWSANLEQLASQAGAVCFGSLAQRSAKSRETIECFLKTLPSHCLRILDINLRAPFYSREVIESSLQNATILKMNDLELPLLASMLELAGRTPAEHMHCVLERFGLTAVFVTRGERGAMAVSRNQIAEHAGYVVQVRDTVGAGDAFTAALAHCLLSGVALEETLAIANRWAAWVASEAGGMPQLKEETRREMFAQ